MKRTRNTFKNICITSIAVAITACSSSIQTTSGADFSQGTAVGGSTGQAANVKPLLQFPANFCIVKMSGTKMMSTNSAELTVWQNMASRHRDWGTFVPVNEMTVALISSEGHGSGGLDANIQDVISAAARQHCHAIMSYQVKQDSTGFTATGLLFDTRNGYTYLNATSAGKTSGQAVGNLTQDVERAMAQLVIALNE